MFVSKDVIFILKLYLDSSSEKTDGGNENEDSDGGDESLPWIPREDDGNADEKGHEESDTDSDKDYQDASASSAQVPARRSQ